MPQSYNYNFDQRVAPNSGFSFQDIVASNQKPINSVVSGLPAVFDALRKRQEYMKQQVAKQALANALGSKDEEALRTPEAAGAFLQLGDAGSLVETMNKIDERKSMRELRKAQADETAAQAKEREARTESIKKGGIWIVDANGQYKFIPGSTGLATGSRVAETPREPSMDPFRKKLAESELIDKILNPSQSGAPALNSAKPTGGIDRATLIRNWAKQGLNQDQIKANLKALDNAR